MLYTFNQIFSLIALCFYFSLFYVHFDLQEHQIDTLGRVCIHIERLQNSSMLYREHVHWNPDFIQIFVTWLHLSSKLSNSLKSYEFIQWSKIYLISKLERFKDKWKNKVYISRGSISSELKSIQIFVYVNCENYSILWNFSKWFNRQESWCSIHQISMKLFRYILL